MVKNNKKFIYLEEIFNLNKDDEIKGILLFTYTFDGQYFEKILLNMGVKSDEDIKKMEFFFIIVHHSGLLTSSKLFFNKIKLFYPEKQTSFHNKFCIIKIKRKKKIIYRIIIGSFNITKDGLKNNYEFVYYEDVIANNTKEKSEVINYVNYIIKNVNRRLKNKIKLKNFYCPDLKNNKIIFQYNDKYIYQQLFDTKSDLKEISIMSPFWDISVIKRIIKDFKNCKINLYLNNLCDAKKIYEKLKNKNKIQIFYKDIYFLDRPITLENELKEVFKENIDLKNDLKKEIINDLFIKIKNRYFYDGYDIKEKLNIILNQKKNILGKSFDKNELKNFCNSVIDKINKTDEIFEKNNNHAKLYLFKFKDKSKLFITSANATCKGLGLNKKNNIEIGVLLKVKKTFNLNKLFDKFFEYKLYDGKVKDINQREEDKFIDIKYLIDDIISEIVVKNKKIENNLLILNINFNKNKIIKKYQKDISIFVEKKEIKKNLKIKIDLYKAYRGIEILIYLKENINKIIRRELTIDFSEQETNYILTQNKIYNIYSPDEIWDTNNYISNYQYEEKEYFIDREINSIFLSLNCDRNNSYKRFPFQTLMKNLFSYDINKKYEFLKIFHDKVLKDKNFLKYFINYYNLKKENFINLIEYIKENFSKEIKKFKLNFFNRKYIEKCLKNIS
ncbi:MAG: hypothetical protein N2114_01320 [Candidatus Goldbacteria bacterium]|nr:hypothetical protein [Candidatus Goldiibacteriota bacterium]